MSSTGGISLVDFNHDNVADLYVANGYDVSDPRNAVPQRNRIYFNKSGEFIEDSLSVMSLQGSFSSGSSWGDIDNDGDLDVFIVNQRNQNNQLFVCEQGTYRAVDSSPLVSEGGDSYSSAWVDVDSDGLLDLYVGNGGLSHRGPDFLYRNKGNNEFEKIDCEISRDTTATIGGIWGDFNNDNLPDFFLTDQFGPEILFINQRDWKFQRKILQKPRENNVFPNSSATAADYDNDGDLDIFICSMYGSFNALYINDGEGNFRITSINDFPEGGHTYLATWMDINNDGWQDLIAFNWGSSPVVYLNQRTKMISIQVDDLTDKVLFPSSAAFADIQNDGLLDLVVGQWPNYPGEY